MHYQRGDVIIAFRFSNSGVLNPSEAQLNPVDDSLFDFFDEHLRKEAPKAGIDPSLANLSRLAVLAAMGSGSSKTKAQDACTYFRNVDGATSVLVDNSAGVVEVAIGAAPRTRGVRKAAAKKSRAPAKRGGRKSR